MKILLVDNEKKFRDTLRKLLELYCPEVTILGEANGVATGLAAIERYQPELVFLDVQMDDGTGLDLLRKIPGRNFEVVFTTAFDQFALDAIKLSALDYLLKPIDPDELMNSIDKANKSLAKQAQRLRYTQLEALLQNMEQSSRNSPKKIVLKDAENVYLVDINDIIRCEASGSYTQFHLTNNRKIMVSKNLREYENTLKAHGFYRSHHSHLFNIHQLDRYDKSIGGSLIMKDGSLVPVSVRRKEPLLKLLTAFYQ